MEMNRNQWFMVGLIVFLIGLQLRAVSSYQLNEAATRFLVERARKSAPADNSVTSQATLFDFNNTTATPAPMASRRVIQLPEWSGWCLMSLGSVMILHSLAMRRPD